MVQSTEILIIGGGSAGIAAAVAASRSGVDVVLVERNTYLGGKATAAEVGTICGLYVFSKQKDPQIGVKGFAREFALRLQQVSHSYPLSNSSGLHFLPYSVEGFKELSMNLMSHDKICLRMNSELKGLTFIGGEIREASVQTEGHIDRIECKSIIDCTGNGLVTVLAGSSLVPSNGMQAAAQVFTIANIQVDNEATLSFILMRETAKGISEGKLESFFDRVYVVPGSLKDGSAQLKMAIPIPVTSNNHFELREKAVAIIDELMYFLRSNCTTFKESRIVRIADEVGIRTEDRPLGKYVLTEQDVLNSRKFEHAIANSFWPIEEWGQHRSVQMKYSAEKEYYQIPAESLMSEDIPNLFFAGRGISADDKAIASARVMGTCLQTGYAAGKIAAAYLSGTDVSSAIQAIQEEQIFD